MTVFNRMVYLRRIWLYPRMSLPLVSMLALAALASGCTPARVSSDEETSSSAAQALTASFQPGANGYAGIKDVQITNQYVPNGQTTRSGDTLLLYRRTASDPYESEALIRFDSISLPAGSQVTSATLRLTFENWTTGFTIRGRYLNAAWNPAEGSTLGWLIRDDGFSWAVAGARGNGTDLVSTTNFSISGLAGTGEEVRTVTLDTARVQSWIDSPAANQGVLLYNETADVITRVRSSEDAVVSRRPLLTIEYTAADATPPTASMTAPAGGATVSSAITLSANAGDNVGVVGVQFLVDGNAVGSEDASSPYSVVYETSSLPNGTHSLAARARDAAGNVTTSAAITVTFNNVGPSGTFQTGVGGYVGTKDVQITNQSVPNGVTTRTSSEILLYRNTGAGPYESEGFLRFDAISLPAGSTVTGANLRLTFSNWVTGFTLRGYYLNSSWNPSEGSGLGWLDRDTGTAWATPAARGMGTDLVANKTFTLSGLPTGSDVVQSVSLDAAVVQGWLNAPATNHGILLFNETPDKITRFYSSDQAQVARRPLLTISYSTGSGNTVPPTVALTAPASGATLVGSTTLSANASDDQQLVAGVQFLADGMPIGSEDTAAPYSISYDTQQLSNGSHAFTARARDAAGNQATSAVVQATVNNPVPAGQQTLTLVPNGGTGSNELVSLGVPFPVAALTDSNRFRVFDNQGAEVPIFVKTTLRWHWTDNSIRALKVQFFANMSAGQKVYTFTLSTLRNTALDIAEQPYQNGTLIGKFNYHVPRVLGVLNPQWMCSSRIAGPQKPKTTQTAYDSYFENQFAWAKNINYTADFDSWLFDRPTAIYKQYIRTGNIEYLKEAFNSYRFYIDHITTSGLAPGGFEMSSPVGGYKDPRDVKYLYVEPVLLHLALTGDDTQGIATKVPLMADQFWSGGWHFPHTAYTSLSQAFTERQTGLMLLAQVAAFEITGNASYLSRINTQIGHFYNHQQNNPDGLPYDGSWRHDWNVHEGGTGSFNASDQRRGGSPWMSENIIDGLWHAWLVTGDTRIPVMVKGFALDFMEHHGFGQPSHFAASGGVTWRNGCNEPNGTIAMYWSSSVMSAQQIVQIMNSDGWYSDSHNPENALSIAAAYYFSTNATERQTLRNRMDLIEFYYNATCANQSSTVRKFNWNNRGSAVARWMLDQ